MDNAGSRTEIPVLAGPDDAPLCDLAARSATRLDKYRSRSGMGDLPVVPPVDPVAAAAGPAAHPHPVIDLCELYVGAGPVFVRHCYRMILRRDPDPAGATALVDGLVTGRLTRLDVIRSLRSSEEGRRVGVGIRGLDRRSFVDRVLHLPILGYALRLVIHLVRLPRSIRALETEVHLLWRRIDELEQRSDGVDGR